MICGKIAKIADWLDTETMTMTISGAVKRSLEYDGVHLSNDEVIALFDQVRKIVIKQKQNNGND